MAGKKYTEPITIRVNSYGSDAAGGRVTSGSTVLDTVNATIVQKPSRWDNLNGVRQQLIGVYEITIWANPNYTITTANYVEWRGKTLTIQEVLFSDDFTKVRLTVKE